MEWWRRADSARCVGAVPEVAGITHDSRAVRRGDAFAALPGRQHDGHDYLEAALTAGAAAAVVQADREAKWAPLAGRLPLLVVPDVRAALGAWPQPFTTTRRAAFVSSASPARTAKRRHLT